MKLFLVKILGYGLRRPDDKLAFLVMRAIAAHDQRAAENEAMHMVFDELLARYGNRSQGISMKPYEVEVLKDDITKSVNDTGYSFIAYRTEAELAEIISAA